MEKIIETLAWPAVVLIISLVFIFTFRQHISSLIARTKRVSKDGLETHDGQSSQQSETLNGFQEFLKSFDNPLIIEVEKLILEDLRERKIENPVERETALIKSLAANQVVLRFERIYKSIWASQIALLRFVNSRGQGCSYEDLEMFYNRGKESFPDWYENYPFDSWIGFLDAFNLITTKDANFFITVAGREFLKYLADTGKAEPLFG